MEWGDSTVWMIELGRVRKVKEKMVYKVTYTSYEVPAVYHRLVGQLTNEEAHGRLHNSHESRRRQMYARRVLDIFPEKILANVAKPIEEQVPPVSFQSHTLTPILQCQLCAVHDAYAPSVYTAMLQKGEASLTLLRVTQIYLRQDPTLAYLAPHYRRHLLYVPKPQWYLGVVVNEKQLGNPGFYNAVREHHDQIMMAIREEREEEERKGKGKGKGKGKEKEKEKENEEEHDEEHIVCDPNGMPLLRRAEVRAIVLEGLEDFFKQELSAVVCYPTLLIAIPGADHYPCRASYWMR